MKPLGRHKRKRMDISQKPHQGENLFHSYMLTVFPVHLLYFRIDGKLSLNYCLEYVCIICFVIVLDTYFSTYRVAII